MVEKECHNFLPLTLNSLSGLFQTPAASTLMSTFETSYLNCFVSSTWNDGQYLLEAYVPMGITFQALFCAMLVVCYKPGYRPYPLLCTPLPRLFCFRALL